LTAFLPKRSFGLNDFIRIPGRSWRPDFPVGDNCRYRVRWSNHNHITDNIPERERNLRRLCILQRQPERDYNAGCVYYSDHNSVICVSLFNWRSRQLQSVTLYWGINMDSVYFSPSLLSFIPARWKDDGTYTEKPGLQMRYWLQTKWPRLLEAPPDGNNSARLMAGQPG
jgi:hypothetical protein